MAGNLTGLHVFANDVSPEPLSLLDTNYSAINAAFNALANFANYYADGGIANAMAVTVTANQTVSYSDGLLLQIQVAATNTGATTLNVNAIGPKNVVDQAGNALPSGMLLAGSYITVIYRAAANNFQLLSGGQFASSGAANPTAQVGLATINGSAVTFMRSDAAPALNVGISPTWTGTHTFSGAGITTNFAGKVVIGPPSSGTTLVANVIDATIGLDFQGGTGTTGWYSRYSSNNGSARGYIGIGQTLFTGAAAADFGMACVAGTLRLSANGGNNTHLAILNNGENYILEQPAATGVSGMWQTGYLDEPQNIQNANYSFALTDRGKQVYHSSGAAHTYTIPANASVAFPIGTIIRIIAAGGTVTVAITTDTLTWYPSGSTGSRTLTSAAAATIEKVTATNWVITGVNIT